MKHTGAIGAALASVAVLAAAVLVAWVNLAPVENTAAGNPSGAPAPADVVGPTDGDAAVAVETVEVATATLRETVRLGGEVRARDTVVVFPDTAGAVSRVAVEVGSVVRAGQVIAAVDPSRPGSRFQESPVDAPIGGTVTVVSVRAGDTVSANSPIVTIATLSDLEIEMEVPERYAPVVTVGMQAAVSALAFPDTPIAVRVVRVDPLINTATRSKTAVLRPEPGSGLEAGMFVQVEFPVRAASDAAVVPLDALVREGDTTTLFVVTSDGIARERVVETGITDGEIIEIGSGVEPGEAVVLYGTNRVRDNEAVRVVRAGGRR